MPEYSKDELKALVAAYTFKGTPSSLDAVLAQFRYPNEAWAILNGLKTCLKIDDANRAVTVYPSEVAKFLAPHPAISQPAIFAPDEFVSAMAEATKNVVTENVASSKIEIIEKERSSIRIDRDRTAPQMRDWGPEIQFQLSKPRMAKVLDELLETTPSKRTRLAREFAELHHLNQAEAQRLLQFAADERTRNPIKWLNLSCTNSLAIERQKVREL